MNTDAWFERMKIRVKDKSVKPEAAAAQIEKTISRILDDSPRGHEIAALLDTRAAKRVFRKAQ